MNLDLTTELEPTASEDDSGFKFQWPLPPWDDDEGFRRSMNRYGAVYVRILCAQRLPCPVGSSVVGAASLPPFSGRVKTTRKSAFLSTYEHGVCAKWDRDDGLCSMVNSWNSEESPIPSIQITLMFSPLGMGFLDFTMCSVKLSCQVIMKAPGTWKSQWCQMTLPTNMLGDTPTNPLIKLEAMFVPTSVDGKPAEISFASLIRKKKVTLSPARNPRSLREDSLGSSSTHIEEVTSPKWGTPPNRPEQTLPEPENDTHDYSSEELTTADEASAHMLRVSSFWVPTACHVCSKILLGHNKGFHCEACRTVCCEDCRLNVDLELPCGSDQAKLKVESSIRNKISVGNIMSVVAPDKVYAEQRKESLVPLLVETQEDTCIGCLRFEFKRACLFLEPLAPCESPQIVFGANRPIREGEYYCRITSSMGGKTARTRPAYSGSPHFNSKELEIMVANYGEEFRLDCVDARTDQLVGSALLSTQGILQMQRDEVILKNGASLLQCLSGPIVERGVRPPMKLMLRKGVNKAFGIDFYIPPKEMSLESKVGGVEKGAISGWLEVCLGLEEFVYRLYHPRRPIVCPKRQPDDFNTSLFQVHIMRAKNIFDELNDMLDLYFYMVSWKNTFVTGCTLITLVSLCLRFDMEYIGSLPAFVLAAALANSSFQLKRKGRKETFIKREIEASRRAGKVSVNYVFHRPVGTIGVSVGRGRSLFSRDLGIPGKASCTILYDPLRLASPEARSRILEHDKAAESSHQVGTTSGVLSADPEWNDVHSPSAENMRLCQVLRQADDFYPAKGPELSLPTLSFPVLQPFELKGRRRDESGRYLDGVLKGWDKSTGAIVVQVQLAIGFDQVLGEVVVPVSQIVNKGELNGWFQVLEAGTKNLASVEDDAASDIPRIQISMKWNPPKFLEGHEDTEREISYAIQEELVRSSQILKQTQFDLVGTSIGAVNTALGIGGNIQLVQNTLGDILDTIETAINLFNFTDPFKSSLVFVGLAALAMVLITIPTRYVILLAVMGQYGSTLVDRYRDVIFGKDTEKKDSEPHRPAPNRDEADHACLQKWVANMMRSLPTNEDLRRAYFWESRRLGFDENEKFASEKRVARLERLWKARWHSTVEIRAVDDPTSGDKDEDSESSWNSVFVVLEGRRFIFWETVTEFDRGELASGLLVLSGHAGITTPSPIETREIPEDRASRVVTLFGKGADGQERMTIILPDDMSKRSLEAAVAEVTSKDD